MSPALHFRVEVNMVPRVIPGVSHTDHNIPPDALDAVLCEIGDVQGFGIRSLSLPDWAPAVPCDLVGPATGGAPVPEADAFYATRGQRPHPSRCVVSAPVMTREITAIFGPAGDDSPGTPPDAIIVYTAYGGPCAPREPWDASIQGDPAALAESRAFWALHALARPAR